MGSFVNSRADAANAGAAAVAGSMQRKQRYAAAYGLERESADAGWLAGRQLTAMRQNEDLSVGRQRAENAASGFAASSGSKLDRERSVAEVLEEAIANAAASYAVQDEAARNQAARLRKEGDDALRMGEIAARYYSRRSRIANTVGNWQLAGGVLDKVGGALVKYDLDPLDGLFTKKGGK